MAAAMSTSGRPTRRPSAAGAARTRSGARPGGARDDATPTAPEPAPPSPLADAVVRVGDRWTLLVVDALLGGPRRFGELSEAVSGIAPNILTQRLRHLVDEGLVLQRPYSDRPPRFEYELTQAGRELAGALRLLADWGARHAPSGGASEAARHGACGTPLEARWWCPTSEQPVDDDPGGDDLVHV
jgi:DNA-binding HxlR family transcriptional regulator